MPLDQEVIAAGVHAVDASSKGQSGGKPKSFDKLHALNYPVRATGSNVVAPVRLLVPELVHGATTGEPVQFDRRGDATADFWLEDRDRIHQPLEVEIRQETVQQYYDFLYRYVTNWGKLAGLPSPDPNSNNLLEYALKDPERRSDALLVRQLTEQVVGKDGKTRSRMASPEKIREYLQTADGWAEATMAMEQYAIWAELGLGLSAVFEEKPWNPKRDSTDLNIDRRAILNNDTKTLRDHLKHAASRGISAVGAALLWLDPRASGKERLSFQANLELLEELKANASDVDRALLSAMTGVDIDRIDLIPTFGGGLRAQYRAGPRPNVRGIESDIATNNRARKNFLTQLGIDEPPTMFNDISRDRTRDITYMDIDIMGGAPEPEGLRMRYSMEIMDVYAQLYDANPPANQYEAARLRIEAREKVRVRYAERRIDFEAAKKELGDLDAMRTKLGKMETNGGAEYQKDKKEEYAKKKTAAETKLAEAKAREKALTEGEESLTKREQQTLGQERALVTNFELNVVTAGIDKAVQDKLTFLRDTTLKGLQDKIDKALEKKSDEAKKFTVDEVIVPLKDSADKYSDAVGKLGAGAKSITAPNFDVQSISEPAVAAINAKYDEKIARLRKEVEAVEKQISDLKTQYAEYRRVANERDTEIVGLAMREPGQLETFGTAYDTFLPAIGVPLCTEDELRTKPVEELAQLLPTGTDEEKILKTLQARATLEANDKVKLTPDMIMSVNLLDIAGIDPDEILTTDRRELAQRLKAYYVSIGSAKTDDDVRQEIADAYTGIGRLMKSLAEARIHQDTVYYEGVQKDMEKRLTSDEDLDASKAKLGASIAVVEDHLDTYRRLYELVDNDAELKELANRGLVDKDDETYSEAERDQTLAIQKGIIAWYELLYPEYRTADRDKRFKAINSILKADILSELIDKHILKGKAFDPKDPDEVLDLLEGDITAGDIDAPLLQEGIKNIIDYVRKYAMAI